MPNCAAAFSALLSSREEMAAISLHWPFCIAGITFLTAIPATPSTPHLTFWLFMRFPRLGCQLLAGTRGVGACRAISLLEFFFGAHGSQVRHAIDAQNAIQVIDLVLEQLGKISQFSGVNLVRSPLQILVTDGDVPVALDLHEDGQKTKAGVPHHDALGTA